MNTSSPAVMPRPRSMRPYCDPGVLQLSKRRRSAALWRFTYDHPDDAGGGFVSGEFLPRSDGCSLTPMGHDSFINGATMWEFGQWERYAALRENHAGQRGQQRASG